MENKIYFNPQPKIYSQPKEKRGLKKERKPTGELALFKEIFLERKGVCEITGQKIEFSPECFLHVLNKNRWAEFRLDKRNIFMVIFDAHNLYDNGSKEFLLSKYPKAQKIYDRKEELKIESAKPKPII